jgi:LAO/AO transport system kinase
MIIHRVLDIPELTMQLTGETLVPGMTDPWRSRVRALSRAITLVENDPLLAVEVMEHASFRDSASRSRVIGLTGLPGAGKSTLSNLLVRTLRAQEKTVAVLAVDPSSPLSGGAILGDRLRMQEHFRDPGVFIRSMGARGSLGGIARSTRAAIRLSGLLNFDYILVETVGIGQSESEIVELADTTVLVLMPNSGDEVQLMKAGVLQLADIYLINKSDLASPARMMNELHENTAPSDPQAWCPPVLATSALEQSGIDSLALAIEQHALFEKSHPKGMELKKIRAVKEILRTMHALIEPEFLAAIENLPPSQLIEVVAGQRQALSVAMLLSKQFRRQPT